MEHLFTEIEKAIESSLYQLALSMALCIPDICGALESENGEATGAKYRKWYDKNVDKNVTFLESNDCYYLRCSLLHQSTSEHKKMSYNKILVVPPGNSNMIHGNQIDGAMNIDLKIFCDEIVRAARIWFSKTKDDEIVNKNYKKNFRYYPTGLDPYTFGFPVFG